MPQCSVSFILLLLWGLLGNWVLCICPSVCSCSRGHRVVDCSSRGLTKLPTGLQHNIRFLNLSFNSLQGLDSQLSHYAHLRTLDLSYNLLETLPPALPRSLWEILAAGNHLRSLDKKDTAFHWNLKLLDLSYNELEKVVFINNTLLSLRSLNLSYNRFWTVPTNMPHNLECIDLSHNNLVQILPGSLDRLPRLAKFYLHANRFPWLSDGVFNKLTGLEVITLADNPWACEEEDDIARLHNWAEQTRAAVLGCPCHTKPVCGQTYWVATNSSLFTEPLFWVNGRAERHDSQSPAMYNIRPDKRGLSESGDHVMLVWASTSSHSFYQHTSTTAHPPSSAKTPRVTDSEPRNHAALIKIQMVTLPAVVMAAAFITV